MLEKGNLWPSGHRVPTIKVYGGAMEPLKGCTSSLRRGAYGPLAIGCLSRSMEGGSL